MAAADRATVYDNSRAAAPFRVVAECFNGEVGSGRLVREKHPRRIAL